MVLRFRGSATAPPAGMLWRGCLRRRRWGRCWRRRGDACGAGHDGRSTAGLAAAHGDTEECAENPRAAATARSAVRPGREARRALKKAARISQP
eukprot:4948295-Pyramimonas_sp.AAC.1